MCVCVKERDETLFGDRVELGCAHHIITDQRCRWVRHGMGGPLRTFFLNADGCNSCLPPKGVIKKLQ